MAGPNEKVAVQSADQALAGILSLLGGTKTTQNPGNTAALQNSITSLQGMDPQAMLASIFQQAAGQIPGIQNAYGNAMGARRSNNSAIQNALNSILAQTTVAAQDKIASQQIANQQQQIQAGSAIANATKGTTQKQGTNLTQAAGMLALLQGLTKLTGSKDVQELFGKATGVLSGTAASTAAGAPGAAPTEGPQMSMAPAGFFSQPNILAAPAEQPVVSLGDQYNAPGGISYAPDYQPLDINTIIGNQAPEMSTAPAGFMPSFNLNDLIAEPAPVGDEAWFDESYYM
jgi:hypothetical protein